MFNTDMYVYTCVCIYIYIAYYLCWYVSRYVLFVWLCCYCGYQLLCSNITCAELFGHMLIDVCPGPGRDAGK